MPDKLSQRYFEQVALLLQILPSIAKESCFALKGGTAINLFVREMPRLSVDIDLTYVLLEDRQTSLQGIHNALMRIRDDLLIKFPELPIENRSVKNSRLVNKLFVGTPPHYVKIEPNELLRGTIFPVEKLDLSDEAEELFQRTVLDVPVISFAELYGGKICAALDRQHPRDVFDIKLLYENEGLTDELRQAFVVYLASGSRPMYELLDPNLLDVLRIFEEEFLGMNRVAVTYEELEAVRLRLIDDIKTQLTQEEREFLVSIKRGEPNYNLLPFENLDRLPALQWKLVNIKKMDAKKHQEMLAKLRKALDL